MADQLKRGLNNVLVLVETGFKPVSTNTLRSLRLCGKLPRSILTSH